MLTLLIVWLWLSCAGALWAYLTDGAKYSLDFHAWVMVVLAPLTITGAVVIWLFGRALIGKQVTR